MSLHSFESEINSKLKQYEILDEKLQSIDFKSNINLNWIDFNVSSELLPDDDETRYFWFFDDSLKEYKLVDCESGKISSLFNHEKLLNLLNSKFNDNFIQLPSINSISFKQNDLSIIYFEFKNKSFSFNNQVLIETKEKNLFQKKSFQNVQIHEKEFPKQKINDGQSIEISFENKLLKTGF